MNQASTTTTWSPMVSAPEDDFSSFLDFNDLQLNFSTFDGASPEGESGRQGLGHGIDAEMENGVGMMVMKDGDLQQQIDPSLASMPTALPEPQDVHSSSESLLDMNMQVQLFHQQQLHYHQQLRMEALYHQRPGMVPPTPTSLEIHGQPRSYPQMDPTQRAMYEHYARKQQNHMVFTPLVSPAVTPVDNTFRLPEYTIPGEYFSPLTSPALEAQRGPAQRSVYGPIRSSDTSDTTSPTDMDVDHSIASAAVVGAALRKSKRKSASVSTKPPGRSVRQSPAMKPQSRRKQPSSTVIPPNEVAELMEGASRPTQNGTTLTNNGKLALPYGQDSSEAESVSPEPLSEILMPPPATPRPGSVGRSPHITAQGSQSAPLPPMRNTPATPASLMKIRKKADSAAHARRNLEESNLRAEAEMEQIMEGITLPDSVVGGKPTLPTLDTTVLNDDQVTPTLSARGTKSATTPASSTIMPSPQIGSVASPASSISSKRGEARIGGRGSKKRNSISSSQVSPALRPKISPSIKPLLPEGSTINAETSALYLASKSNYQNILDNTHLPGVSYPEALSTNLTSKRTSHKIAEQGRRNRINNALQEIASLLPATTPSMTGMAGDVTNMMSGTAAQQSNSKASTVEMAIEYIRSLQSELMDVKGELEVAKKQLGGEGVGVKGEAVMMGASSSLPSSSSSSLVPVLSSS
ncbi:hypothetical protein MMC19_003235 [Ptychographa xylographoides]|nr:hypothetical protein [Ptychographa xylographoides]